MNSLLLKDFLSDSNNFACFLIRQIWSKWQAIVCACFLYLKLYITPVLLPAGFLRMNLLLYKTSLKIKTCLFKNVLWEGNSVIIIDRHDYIKKIDNILSDQNKFTNVNLKDDTSWNFASNQEKRH